MLKERENKWTDIKGQVTAMPEQQKRKQSGSRTASDHRTRLQTGCLTCSEGPQSLIKIINKTNTASKRLVI